MLILGIDPGTARLGYGLVKIKDQRSKIKDQNKKDGRLEYVGAGCITTVLETPMAERLLYLQEEIGKIIARYKPQALAIEQLFFGINSKTVMAVGQARGVVMAEAARHHIPLFEYQGLSVKHALTGFGRADKKQIQESVRKHLRMRKIIKPDDAADGLAIAITHHIKTNKISKNPIPNFKKQIPTPKTLK